MSSAQLMSTPIASSSHPLQQAMVASESGRVASNDRGRADASPRVEQQVTPRASTSANLAGLLPPFGMEHTSQLPTPQSPRTYGPYSTRKGHSPESPLSHGVYNSRSNGLQSMTRIVSGDAHSGSAAASFITPEPSPEARRKLPLPSEEQNTVLTTSSSSFVSPHTPPRSRNEVKTDAAAPPLKQPRTFSPPPSSPDINSSSGLSSPFMERLTLVDPTRARSSTPQTVPANPSDGMSPAHGNDVFSSLERGRSTTLPPLSAPVPYRPLGREIQRIRMQMAADQAARLSETEARRPDYLVREKRFSSNGDPMDHEIDMADPEQEGPLGVTESPVKGRRLKLFQETSEESFEQSLLAGGYPGYGYTPAYGEPHTPDNKGKNTISQRAMQWLQQATPGQPGPSSVLSDPEADLAPSEKEVRKRKRLAAFEDRPEKSEPPVKLHAVEVEGKGRLLINKPPEDVPSSLEAPAKKRGGRRRKRGGAAGAKKRGHIAQSVPDEGEELKPNWLDSAFPWNLRVQERAETARLEQEERLKWIERYFEHDTSAEEEDNQSLHLALETVEEETPPFRRGRGKMVPLRASLNNSFDSSSPTKYAIPSDPADARVALLSRRSVREFVHRLGLQGAYPESDGEIVCICRGRGDGDSVQCDDCHKWFHLKCIGIRDVAELGPEEEPWYCADCLGLGDMAASDPMSEPTFVPTEESSLTHRIRDPLFYQGSLQESPTTPWSTTHLPRTPIRGRDLTHTFSSRSSWGDSSQIGPSTPNFSSQNVRVYSTPNPFDRLASQESPFDPTTTPSRGIQFGAPVTTPTGMLWPTRPGQARTPVRAGRDIFKQSGGLSFNPLNDSGPTFSPYRNIYSFEDTPVRRSKPGEERRGLVGRQLWDSPLPPPPAQNSAPMDEDGEPQRPGN